VNEPEKYRLVASTSRDWKPDKKCVGLVIHATKTGAHDEVRRWRHLAKGQGRTIRVRTFMRSVRADNIDITLWVVVAREPTGEPVR
jgi:hypothetical protein